MRGLQDQAGSNGILTSSHCREVAMSD